MKKNLILVLNCGSSSLKFSLIKPENGETLLSGLAERLLSEQASIKINVKGQKKHTAIPHPFDHRTAIMALVDSLVSQQLNLQICAIGHRVVHGGEHYCMPTLITDEVKNTISNLSQLAPLHNPANLMGINAAETVFTDVPQVAVFDTAFHQTMPEKAYIYGIPYALYQEHGIRRYGFHGTSHYFVAQQAAKTLDKSINEGNFISAHLGNGCSVTAIKNGKSVDTSLGLTPLEGVMMGTRSGDVDAGIIFHLINQLGYTTAQVSHLLHKESGLLGVSGLSNDCREIEEAWLKDKNPRAKLALDIFCYRVAKSVASFTASLTSIDALIFTGGIGENSTLIRANIIDQLSLLNFFVATDKNNACCFGKAGNIGTENSRPILVIPTNEEWVIAEQTSQLLFNNSSTKE
ncbi:MULTISPECIES: acetate kinase [unclassified Colwellia]|jgi:acetate kinase|uniref:acetate kinase n=1 Tax=unclassified Colwellia TaxID=196834 RepID=UPI0015F3908E|nr:MULTISPECIES: acetate kinase [unclassified Colwellia]MBA6356121.1 acetate kinase [Colwellia sp. BRX8-3]MBA6359192.1 acetate kinase [Colwellia sp. BRX8-6]MBA6368157.1 acetate kinase [Colwellia sp. BRX8-5]MBA6373986.1 acetate kinase [Colwellia sp. BRX8-2]